MQGKEIARRSRKAAGITGKTRRKSRSLSAATSMELLETRRLFSTFTVTSAADSGTGTLRAAITSANGLAGADTIVFSLGGSPQTIQLASVLPDVSSPIT